MDAPDEQLQAPLMAPDDGSNASTTATTMASSAQGTTLRSAPGAFQSNPINLNRHFLGGDHYIAANDDEEEKMDSSIPIKRDIPYSAPNVHPYAMPSSYEGIGQAYGGGGTTTAGDNATSRIALIQVVFDAMYTLAAALTILQGFGMLIHFTLPAVILGFYTMGFGAIVILFDIKAVVYDISIEQTFPFLGFPIGRALTIAFFAALCSQTYEYGGWTQVVVLFNLLVAAMQVLVFFTTKTITPAQNVSGLDEDLPGL